MTRTIKLALAFTALAGAVGSIAYAAGRPAGDGMQERPMMRLQKALHDSPDGVTLDQFEDIMNSRLKDLIAKNGGKLTVGELADALEKARYERMAKRMIDRFDVNGDGVLTADELSGRQKKLFALLDKNDDGKIEKSELPRRGWGRHGWGHGMMMHHMTGEHGMMDDGGVGPDGGPSGNGSDDGAK